MLLFPWKMSSIYGLGFPIVIGWNTPTIQDRNKSLASLIPIKSTQLSKKSYCIVMVSIFFDLASFCCHDETLMGLSSLESHHIFVSCQLISPVSVQIWSNGNRTLLSTLELFLSGRAIIMIVIGFNPPNAVPMTTSMNSTFDVPSSLVSSFWTCTTSKNLLSLSDFHVFHLAVPECMCLPCCSLCWLYSPFLPSSSGIWSPCGCHEFGRWLSLT